MAAVERSMLAVAIALLATLLLFVGLAWLLERPAAPQATAEAALSAPPRALSRPLRAKLRSAPRPAQLASPLLRRPPAERAPRPPERPKPVEELRGQIVETARPDSERVPERARYLGRYDMAVEREQKSSGRKRQGRDLGHVQIDKPSQLQSPTSKSRDPTQLAGGGSPQPVARRPGRQAARQEIAPPQPAASERAAVAQAPTQAPQPAPAALPTPGPAVAPSEPAVAAEAAAPARSDMLRPSVLRGGGASLLLPATSAGNIRHNLQALAGSPGSDDYLPDVEDEGATNLLNTRKYRYWDFFQRVRERVRDEWNPAAIWQARDPSGKRYGVRDRLTIVRVRLDPQGQVKELRVHKPSGLSFLDDEATRAFSAGGPYSNPPAGLLNERGEVEFQFGFMFEISSSRFRFYRTD